MKLPQSFLIFIALIDLTSNVTILFSSNIIVTVSHIQRVTKCSYLYYSLNQSLPFYFKSIYCFHFLISLKYLLPLLKIYGKKVHVVFLCHSKYVSFFFLINNWPTFMHIFKQYH